MAKRVFLFIITNLLVVTTISIVLSLLGVKPYLTAHGIDYQSLAIFCLIWGMGGSFISLLLSKFMAKKMMGVTIIDPNTSNSTERQLYNTVQTLAQRAGLPTTPELGIYHSPEVNAFATGPSKRNALVAVSTGLLQHMDNDAIEGVLAHEISHIANGDMVTMTLLQGIVNAFALFFSRIIAYAIATAISRDDNKGISNMTFFLLSVVLDILLTLLGSIVVAAFSRWREFRADAGGAKLAGTSKMIGALKCLQNTFEKMGFEDKRGKTINSLKISNRSGRLSLFASHPPLEERIKKLQKA